MLRVRNSRSEKDRVKPSTRYLRLKRIAAVLVMCGGLFAAAEDRTEAQTAVAAAEAPAQQALASMADPERDKAELRARLLQQLSAIPETRETSRGLIVNLSDVLFDARSAKLISASRSSLLIGFRFAPARRLRTRTV